MREEICSHVLLFVAFSYIRTAQAAVMTFTFSYQFFAEAQQWERQMQVRFQHRDIISSHAGSARLV